MRRVARKTIYCITLIFLIFIGAFPNSVLGFTHVWHPNSFMYQPLNVPTKSPVSGDILIDNFEYWDSPYNHGWVKQEPAYPVYGFGIGYTAVFNTVIDLQEGSRVLDVYRTNSVFLLGTPFERISLSHTLTDPKDPTGKTPIYLAEDSGNSNCVLSFKFRAPLGIEPWDIFRMEVTGETTGGGNFIIQLIPLQPANGSPLKIGDDVAAETQNLNIGSSTHNLSGYLAEIIQEGDLTTKIPRIIQVEIGRNYLDGTWHIVSFCLNEINETAQMNKYGSLDPDWTLKSASGIRISGQRFRLDDIIFRAGHYERYDYPDLFQAGPRYAQIFEPYRYLFIADYEGAGIRGFGRSEARIIDLMLDMNNFITEPAVIKDIWRADLIAMGQDPNYADPNSLRYGKKQPYLSTLINRDFIIDINLPVFSDGDLRINGTLARDAREQRPLAWNATIGGFGAQGIQTSNQSGTTSFLENLPINPYDGMPTYIPAYYAAIDAIVTYGKTHYGPALCFMLESSMWNAGYTVWPNIAYIDYIPQVFEDLIVTIEVTNGAHSDVMTFPVSVVNYPVENYAPVVQLDIDDQIFHLGQKPDPQEGTNVYVITFVDPDCFIFSLSQFPEYGGRTPATSHLPGWPLNEISPYAAPQDIRTDQQNLRYRLTLNGIPYYQYGPWKESVIDPHSGLIQFTPEFEDAIVATVTCTDEYGSYAYGEITIFCITPGTWLNHPPIVSGGPTNPVVLRAGEELTLHAPLFNIYDPDGDEIYASCNIGACGRYSDGAFIWSFQTNFPGIYHIEVMFYDLRGGYAILWFPVQVKTWWSY